MFGYLSLARLPLVCLGTSAYTGYHYGFSGEWNKKKDRHSVQAKLSNNAWNQSKFNTEPVIKGVKFSSQLQETTTTTDYFNAYNWPIYN